jgi:predicted solute-binding protein
MSTQDQARALAMRHHHLVKNRQQSMLSRIAADVGLDPDAASHYWNHIQGKPHPTFQKDYDRSHASFS